MATGTSFGSLHLCDVVVGDYFDHDMCRIAYGSLTLTLARSLSLSLSLFFIVVVWVWVFLIRGPCLSILSVFLLHTK